MSSASPVAAAVRTTRRQWFRRVATGVVVAAIVGLTVRLLVNSGDELLAAADNLDRIGLGWLALAIVAEVGSYAAYGAAQGELIYRGGGPRLGLPLLTGLSIAAQAAAFCVPGGLAVTAIVTYRVLSRKSVDRVLAGATIVVISILYMVALGALALIGTPIAGNTSVVPDLEPVAGGLVAFAVVLGVGLSILRRRGVLARWIKSSARATDALLRKGADEPAAADDEDPEWSERLAAISFGSWGLVVATALLIVCWLADALCLSLCFFAIGETPPWQGLLLAYPAAQLAATLPFTPGGLGVLEGSLTLALVAFGGAEVGTLSAVLLYRLISFWGLLPTGGLCYLAVRGRRQPLVGKA
ncbi:MAG: putative heme transporter [Solirubrobacteraceae bacterium]|nr:putative heme transporter [Solirubrobacteraceae bacterium]